MNGSDAESSQPFLAFTEESQALTPVFQLLHHIKRDVEVRTFAPVPIGSHLYQKP